MEQTLSKEIPENLQTDEGLALFNNKFEKLVWTKLLRCV